jgi:flagellar basal-body rod modification protein FlgD
MAAFNSATSADLLASLNETSAARKKDETEDRFLTLLVTQLKNQDPLNPLANSEVSTQLAQKASLRPWKSRAI